MARPSSRSNRPSRSTRRNNSTNRNDSFLLFSSDTALGWRVIRRVSFASSERNVDKGIWRRVNSHLGAHIGYQLVCSANCGFDIPSHSSPTYISASEVMLYAGQAFKDGLSRTAGLTEKERAARRGKWDKILPMEDAVERVSGKVELWPHPASRMDDGKGDPVFGDKAIRVYPRVQ